MRYHELVIEAKRLIEASGGVMRTTDLYAELLKLAGTENERNAKLGVDYAMVKMREEGILVHEKGTERLGDV